MRRILLNGNNGTIFPSHGREYIMTNVTDWRRKDNSSSKGKSKPNPTDVQFLVKWNKAKATWTDYNTSFFTVEVFLKYLRECRELSYKMFKSHYDASKQLEWMQYRLCPATKKKEIHLKVTLGNQKQIVVTMDEAIEFFGKDGVEAIAKQYDLMHDRRDKNTVWFHVLTGEEVQIGGKLEPLYAGLHDEKECSLLEKGFLWVRLEDLNWIKPFGIRTSGTFCIIAAAINSSLLSLSGCIELFNSFKRDHLTTGEVKIPFLLTRIQTFKDPVYVFNFQKCAPLLSFSELYEAESLKENKDVLCVCYKTLTAATHSFVGILEIKRYLIQKSATRISFSMKSGKRILLHVKVL
jgi:hypothetical protein